MLRMGPRSCPSQILRHPATGEVPGGVPRRAITNGLGKVRQQFSQASMLARDAWLVVHLLSGVAGAHDLRRHCLNALRLMSNPGAEGWAIARYKGKGGVQAHQLGGRRSLPEADSDGPTGPEG